MSPVSDDNSLLLILDRLEHLAQHSNLLPDWGGVAVVLDVHDAVHIELDSLAGGC